MIMKKLNIVFLDRATFGNDCKIKKPNFPHNWIEYQLTKKNQVFNRVKDADIIITNKVILKNEYLKKLKKLKFIAIPSTGTNIIDLMYCKKLGVPFFIAAILPLSITLSSFKGVCPKLIISPFLPGIGSP